MNRNDRLVRQFADYRAAIGNLGVFQAVLYKWQKFRGNRLPRGRVLELRSRFSQFPLHFRAKTSDLDAFGQIFVAREYRCLDDVRDAGLIIDCGANVGYSAAYFLNRFPNSYVIAIEPDKENFDLLSRNLLPYKGRYTAICSAIWSSGTGLVFSELPFGDGREWARTVREARVGEDPVLMANDIGTLFRESGFNEISILKMDIEGSEAEVFSGVGYQAWIKHVVNLVIELHGSSCRSIFLRAIESEGFALSECDELTVCKRRSVAV